MFVDILSNTSVLVQWSEPTVPNGVITSYEVNVSIAEQDKSMDKIEIDKLTRRITFADLRE